MDTYYIIHFFHLTSNFGIGEIPWYEQNFGCQARVVGFMNNTDPDKGPVPDGGPIRSPEIIEIFKNNKVDQQNQQTNHFSNQKNTSIHSNSIEDLLKKCFLKLKDRPTSKYMFDMHPFFHLERWNTTHKITRRRSSDAMPLNDVVNVNQWSSPQKNRNNTKKTIKQ